MLLPKRGMEDEPNRRPDVVVVADARTGTVLFSSEDPARSVGRRVADLAERSVIVHPDGRPYAPFEWPLARSLATGELVDGEEFVQVADDGTRARYRCDAYPVSDASGEIVAAVSVARPEDRYARQQALVAELGQRVLAGDDVQAVMDHAVAVVAAALGLEPVGIAELLPSGEELLLRAGVGWREGGVGTGRGAAGPASLVGYTMATGGPIVSEDIPADRRFELSALAHAEQPLSAAAVVIVGRDGPFGVLEAFARERRSFSEHDMNFLEAVANVVSIAAERAAYEDRVVEIRAAERRRIARDLHDDALQNLADALAQATGPEAQADPARRLARVVPLLARARQQVRRAIWDLRLGGGTDRPFPDLVAELVELHRSMAPDARIELSTRIGLPQSSLGDAGTEVLRFISEALMNARRHADAQSIHIEVWASADDLCVEIADDGRGFDPDQQRGRVAGTGIKGMRERAQLLDGELSIESTSGRGTVVRLDAPLGPKQAEPAEVVRVLLVEDHIAVREAIASMFEHEAGFDVVAQAASLTEARQVLDNVDVAVIDLGLPDGYGGDLIKDLRNVNSRAGALVLTASIDPADIARAVESGAAATLDKTAPLAAVVDAVRRLHAGETVMPAEEVIELLRLAGREREREYDAREAIRTLTPREREVLQVLAEGLDSQAIADRLHITLRTERNHVANILNKLGVHSRLQALVFALRHRLVEVR